MPCVRVCLFRRCFLQTAVTACLLYNLFNQYRLLYKKHCIDSVNIPHKRVRVCSKAYKQGRNVQITTVGIYTWLHAQGVVGTLILTSSSVRNAFNFGIMRSIS